MANSSAVHTKHTKGKRGRPFLAALFVLLLLAVAAIFIINHFYVLAGGRLYRRDTAGLDLRGTEVSESAHGRLREQLPDADIRWNVPLGSGVYDCQAEALAIPGLTSDNLHLLTEFSRLTSLDASGSMLTEEDFLTITRLLPGCNVVWGVPIGGHRFRSDAETITLRSFSSDELPMFSYFTALKTADCRSCSCYPEILSLKELNPELEVLWQVPVSGEAFPSDAVDIRADSAVTSAGELASLLGYLPSVETVSIPECSYSEEEMDALGAEYPNITFLWAPSLFGTRYTGEETELSFDGREFATGEYETLLKKLRYFPSLLSLDLSGSSLTDEQVFKLCDQYPDVGINWEFELLGQKVSTMDTLWDFTGIELADTAELEAVFPYMHRLEKVDLSDCGLSDEDLDALNQRWESIRVVWTMHISWYNVRTDDTYFQAASQYYGIFTRESVMRFKYCPDMIVMDLGHRNIETLDFLYYMPHVRYLILLDCRTPDISAISSLKEVRFIEMNRAYVDSLDPLLECPDLEDLNITFIYGGVTPDSVYNTLMKLTQVKRVWYNQPLMRAEQVKSLKETYPDKIYHEVYVWEQSNEDPWRLCQNYYDMRDIMGLTYMNGMGGRMYSRIIDGVEYPLDEEFIKNQRVPVSTKH